MKKLVARAYKFRIFPSKPVAKKLEKALGACRFLYNSGLEYEEQLYFSEERFVGRDLDRDVMSAILVKASALKEYTAGTAGINACEDVPLGTSMKQERTGDTKSLISQMPHPLS